MNVNLIDSTLREGFQVCAESIFRHDDDVLAYVRHINQLDIVSRFETSMPGPMISNDVWRGLTAKHREKMQVYVGVAHRFDIHEREELEDGPFGMLSTTLVRHERSDIECDLGRIQSSVGHTALRVGVECIASMTIPEALNIARQVVAKDGVQIVSFNDSNGVMNTEWIQELFSLLRPEMFYGSTLGFHLHNGSDLMAANKAKHILSQAAFAGFPTLELDVTAYGLGDHLGILSILDGAKLGGYEKYDDICKTFAQISVELFSRTYDFVQGTDTDLSHYDDFGQLRAEYIT